MRHLLFSRKMHFQGQRANNKLCRCVKEFHSSLDWSITKDWLFGDKLTVRVDIHSPLSALGTGTEPAKKGLHALLVHETTPKVAKYLKGNWVPTTYLTKYFSSSTYTCFFLFSFLRQGSTMSTGWLGTWEQADFKLRSAYFYLPNAGLKGMWLPCLPSDTFFLNSRICVCVQTGQKICSYRQV